MIELICELSSTLLNRLHFLFCSVWRLGKDRSPRLIHRQQSTEAQQETWQRKLLLRSEVRLLTGDKPHFASLLTTVSERLQGLGGAVRGEKVKPKGVDASRTERDRRCLTDRAGDQVSRLVHQRVLSRR